jgi:hypothetical protein
MKVWNENLSCGVVVATDYARGHRSTPGCLAGTRKNTILAFPKHRKSSACGGVVECRTSEWAVPGLNLNLQGHILFHMCL